MVLNDTIKIEGHFKITSYRKDETIDVYEDKNLVMEVARSTMAKMIANHGGLPINSFVIGTQGHSDNNILNPIQPGYNGFTTSRTKLFSQEADGFYYTILWDTDNPSDGNLVYDSDIAWDDNLDVNDKLLSSSISLYGRGNKRAEDGTDITHENAPCPVEVAINGNKVTYTVTITEDAANGDSSVDVVAFTEAALMCGDDIFSMKTFSARVKENTVRHVIEWAIIF